MPKSINQNTNSKKKSKLWANEKIMTKIRKENKRKLRNSRDFVKGIFAGHFKNIRKMRNLRAMDRILLMIEKKIKGKNREI